MKIAIMGLVMASIIVINRKFLMEGNECAGICSLPLDISIYTLIVIIITATVQSVFGVGVLLFGTPLLLLQYEKSYFVVMGIIHGLTNLGGSLLTAIVHEKNYPKDTTKVTVGVSYGTFALFQMRTLLLAVIGIISIPGFATDNMNISFSNVIYLIVGVVIFLLTEKFFYTNIDNEKYNKIFAVFLFVSGILLILKSLSHAITF